MNEQFCVLPVGGKARVVSFIDDPEFPGQRIIEHAQAFEDFKKLQDREKLWVGNKIIGKGSWWINNGGRRQYDRGMKFMPERDKPVAGVLNLWTGFRYPVRKPEGKSGAAGCNLFLDHC